MKKIISICALSLALVLFYGCSSTPTNDSENLDADSVTAEGDSSQANSDSASNESSGQDELSDFEENKNQEQQVTTENTQTQDELAIDETPKQQEAAPAPEPMQQVVETPPPTISEPTPSFVEIKNVQYKGNDTGGTLVIEATGPLTYTTRQNPASSQYIIEVSNAKLPDRLKRPLNLKDFKGGVGSIDAYQNQGSNVARFVLQLRPGAQEPILQAEGSTLLVATNDTAITAAMNGASGENLNQIPLEGNGKAQNSATAGTSEEEGQQNILTNLSMEDFLADNTKFYGRQISCTFDNVDTQRALEFIMLDSGVNMILDDLTSVGAVNIRLREVPWDQCLVLIMKTKKLGYSRLGNVLRIAKLQDLKGEEDEAVRRAQSRKVIEPLKVRIYPVSYAKSSELAPQIKPFLSKDRGEVTSDTRTNAVIVTDIEENLLKVSRIIKNLDSPPPQVMIEGKIVEAADSFQKSMGINWSFSGQPQQISTNSQGVPVNITPSFSFGAAPSTGGSSTGGATTGFALNVGVLDLFGDLNASLNLFELEGKVKVLSSPRIVTMSNVPATISQTTTPARLVVNATASGSQTSYTRGDPASVTLNVTPQVTNDSTIQMKVDVQRSFYGTPVDVKAPDSAPQFSRNANTTLIVKNGQTSVIGGIFQDDTSEGESGISGLKDIPILGSLFKSKSIKRDKNE